jgi:hypothetical protein
MTLPSDPMATWSITGRVSLLASIGRRLSWLRQIPKAALAALRLALRVVLLVAGLGFLDAAAWYFALPAGLAAVGMSLLVLEWAVKQE